MTVLIRCCVPFCERRARGDEGQEVMCRHHWMTVPESRRKAYTRAIYETHPTWLRDRTRRKPERWLLRSFKRDTNMDRSYAALRRLWLACVRHATRKAL